MYLLGIMLLLLQNIQGLVGQRRPLIIARRTEVMPATSFNREPIGPRVQLPQLPGAESHLNARFLTARGLSARKKWFQARLVPANKVLYR